MRRSSECNDENMQGLGKADVEMGGQMGGRVMHNTTNIYIYIYTNIYIYMYLCVNVSNLDTCD